MFSYSSIISKIDSLHTIGQGTGREIIVNSDINSPVLINDKITSEDLDDLIDQFEIEIFKSVKALLKTPLNIINSTSGKEGKIDNEHLNQPYFFSGHFTTGKDVKSKNKRFVFTIANSNILRMAAGQSGRGPRTTDYIDVPNGSILNLPWNEKQLIIDKALGENWETLQQAIKPSARKLGISIKNLHDVLTDAENPRKFIAIIINQARKYNVTGNIGRRQPQFLLWCFISFLRKNNIVLLPVYNYYIDFVLRNQTDLFLHITFSENQINIIEKLREHSKKYTLGNQLRFMRIAQTILLSTGIDEAGDINPDAFKEIVGSITSLGLSISYRSKILSFSQKVYDSMIDIWNNSTSELAIIEPIGAGFQPCENDTLLSKKHTQVQNKALNPFWYTDVSNDGTRKDHPLDGYQPTAVIQYWATIFRETFPIFKIKNPGRFRSAGCHWLQYIFSLTDPPCGIEHVIRNVHINDISVKSKDTFRNRLHNSSLSPSVRNDILSSLSQMFTAHIRIHGINIRNPIQYDLDRFLEPQVRGKTTRTPLSPEILQFIKIVNSRNQFEFSRNFKPTNWTSLNVNLLRHYRRVVDSDDGKKKMVWWPGLAVLLDLMLTIPLRGFQARWLDTGEGDETILDIRKLNEIPNPLPSARKGRQMGVFTSFSKGLDTSERFLGLRITTNKRAVEFDGRYGIPWCPDDVRDNIEMLSNWQRRFNPLNSPIRAENESQSTHLRNEEVTALIPLIFPLFRDPSSEGHASPPTYQQVQTYWNQLCTVTEDELHATTASKFRLTRDRTRKINGSNIKERVAKYDLHTLRVSGITALIEAGLPPHFVQEIVGHASIVMTIYYHKSHPSKINQALENAIQSRELSLENIPELLTDLDNYDEFLINSRNPADAIGHEMLRSASGNGSFQILSHGICPGGDCQTGGEYVHIQKEHLAVPRSGACSLCRYRITGPMFLVGLVVNANKIMSELHAKGRELAALNDEIRIRRRDGNSTISFESRREILHRELEDLWSEWAAEHHYVHDAANILGDYLARRTQQEGNLPIMAAPGGLANIAVKSERRHPFHLSQLLAKASAYIPSEKHTNAICDRDTFLNELLANNSADPFLLRMSKEARLQAGNLLGDLMAEMVPDQDLQSLHDGKLSLEAFYGLESAIKEIAKKSNSINLLSTEKVTRDLKENGAK